MATRQPNDDIGDSGQREEAQPGPSSALRQEMTGKDRSQQVMQGYGYQVNIFSPDVSAAVRAITDKDNQAREPSARPRGVLPQVWNVESRNPGFRGRVSELEELRKELARSESSAVRALYGMGGVGKTQLAVEFAYRNHVDYDVVWWISAEQLGLVGEQYAALALELGLTDGLADTPTATRKVKAYLRSHDRWLIIFDNVESPDGIRDWIPGGPGHVLITSRHPTWGQIAERQEVGTLPRDDSVELLSSHDPSLTASDAAHIAEAVADLPLALVQAAHFLAETGTKPGEYLNLLQNHLEDVLTSGRPFTYPRSLYAAITIAVDKLATLDPVALAVLSFCAFLGSEPIPIGLLITPISSTKVPKSRTPSLLAPLSKVRHKPIALRTSIATISRFGLARATAEGITLHRLTQAVLRDRLSRGVARQVRTRVEAVLSVSNPGNPDHPESWPRWAVLMPHVLAVDSASSNNSSLRDFACDGNWYLLARGDTASGQQLAEHLFKQWQKRLGPDDQHTLRAASTLARAWLDLGRPILAAALDRDVLSRRRRVLGDNHPDTLRSANNLGLALRAMGETEKALSLNDETFRRRSATLGEDHPDTLRSATNLGVTLIEKGEVERARSLLEGNLSKARRVLGQDDPYTLTTANHLSRALVAIGALNEAHVLSADVLARRKRVLGIDHPHTLHSANDHARLLYQIGEFEQAQMLDSDTLDRRRTTLGADHPDTLASAANLELDLTSLGHRQPGGS